MLQINKQIMPPIPSHLIEQLENKARECRLSIIDMLAQSGGEHLGSALSIIDILVVLYNCFINAELVKANDLNRDYLILSKGHAASALYAVLANSGIISPEILKKYRHNGSKLSGLATKGSMPGVEASTGSLGHGLPQAVGLALALKNDNKQNKVYVLLGDGECQEGSNWEALFVASRYKLNNLIIIVDHNNLQALVRTDELITGSIQERFTAFGCNVQTTNGHSIEHIIQTINNTQHQSAPSVIVAKTIKGKGVSFAENKLEWHYKSLNTEQYEQAKKEVCCQ
jgi:transketolase